MYLSLNKEDFTWSRSKQAFPIFILLWAGGLLLALIYLFTIRGYLQDIERQEVGKLLDSYLTEYRVSNRSSGSFQLHLENHLQGLFFVRITQAGEQLLVVGEKVDKASFKALVALDPANNGVWIPIVSGDRKELLTVVVRKYDNGLQIQAGKSGERGHALYKRLSTYTLFILLASILLLWPLSLYFIKRSLFPLIATRIKITELAEHSKTGLLPEYGSGPELDSLYCEVNRLLQQNRQLVAEMQQSLDNVAHDLRTPMTRLRSVAEYGLQAENDSEKLKEALSDCLEESERVLAMLNIMMSVAEAESGTLRLELQECDLAKSLEQVVSLYEYVSEERGVAVHLVSTEPIKFLGDVTRISQVWANLLDNAIKYSKEGGWVRISYRQETSDSVSIIFEDNGMGISENEQPRIWDRLYRGDRSRSERGLGLGLNYVQAVVAAHRGEVSVTSRLYEGSCFVVRLPIVYVAQLSTQEKSQTSGE